MSSIEISDVRWWPLWAIAVAPCLILLCRTVAVVVIARCVKTEVAKMAIPLVLRPVRPSLFSRASGKQLGPDLPSVGRRNSKPSEQSGRTGRVAAPEG